MRIPAEDSSRSFAGDQCAQACWIHEPFPVPPGASLCFSVFIPRLLFKSCLQAVQTGNCRYCTATNLIRSLPGRQHAHPPNTVALVLAFLREAAVGARAPFVALVAILHVVDAPVHALVLRALLLDVSRARRAARVEEGARGILEDGPCHCGD